MTFFVVGGIQPGHDGRKVKLRSNGDNIQQFFLFELNRRGQTISGCVC